MQKPLKCGNGLDLTTAAGFGLLSFIGYTDALNSYNIEVLRGNLPSLGALRS